jgi:hypothetical protein
VASFPALAVTGNALVGLLEQARPQSVFPNLHFRLYLTAELQTPRQALNEVVSVCAYRTAFNTTRRNYPPRVDPTIPQRFRPSAPLDVYFLVTAWAQDPAQQLRILGWVTRTLEDTPNLPAGFLNRFAGADGSVFRPEEGVDLVAETISQQDLYTIWQVAPSRQQPSLVYVARMILLDSDIPVGQSALVQTRVFNHEELVTL